MKDLIVPSKVRYGHVCIQYIMGLDNVNAQLPLVILIVQMVTLSFVHPHPHPHPHTDHVVAQE